MALDDPTRGLCVVPDQTPITGEPNGYLVATESTAADCEGWVLWPADEYLGRDLIFMIDWETVVWSSAAMILMYVTGIAIGTILSIVLRARTSF